MLNYSSILSALWMIFIKFTELYNRWHPFLEHVTHPGKMG